MKKRQCVSSSSVCDEDCNDNLRRSEASFIIQAYLSSSIALCPRLSSWRAKVDKTNLEIIFGVGDRIFHSKTVIPLPNDQIARLWISYYLTLYNRADQLPPNTLPRVILFCKYFQHLDKIIQDQMSHTGRKGFYTLRLQIQHEASDHSNWRNFPISPKQSPACFNSSLLNQRSCYKLSIFSFFKIAIPSQDTPTSTNSYSKFFLTIGKGSSYPHLVSVFLPTMLSIKIQLWPFVGCFLQNQQRQIEWMAQKFLHFLQWALVIKQLHSLHFSRDFPSSRASGGESVEQPLIFRSLARWIQQPLSERIDSHLLQTTEKTGSSEIFSMLSLISFEERCFRQRGLQLPIFTYFQYPNLTSMPDFQGSMALPKDENLLYLSCNSTVPHLFIVNC